MCIRDSPNTIHQQLRKINFVENRYIHKPIIYNNGVEDLWSVKIQEIRDFQCGTNHEKIPIHQANRLIRVYERYKSVFSDEPGKVKNYQCKPEFKENVEFNRRSYPIAHSLKEAVINQHDPLLLLFPGYINELQEATELKSITIISNNYRCV